jgi:gliding motility-associated peptidyl-prolyl isomerase
MYKFLYILAIFGILVSCKSPEARRPIKSTSGTFIRESVERNKALYQQEEADILAFINANSEIDFITSESGFWYYYNVKDTLNITTPKLGEVVTFTYNLKKLNGHVIQTELESGLQTYKVDQTNQDLISGLRDGIKLMKAGETVTFLLPSYKAFGYYGLENKLGANISIQSQVTLKSIDNH